MPDSPDGKKQPEKPQAGGAPAPGIQISPELKKMLNSELQLLNIMDFIAKDPFVFIFQNKALEQYRVSVFEPVVQGSENLKQEYETKQIAMTVNQLKTAAEEVARQHKVTMPIAKKINRFSLILMLVMFGVLIGTYYIPGMPPEASTYIMFPALIAFCFLPQLIRQLYQKKWKQFVNIAMPELEPRITVPAENLRSFAQSIIFDLRDKLLANGVPLQAIHFGLMSNQYQGLKLIQQSVSDNKPVYYFELAYPAGMEPLVAQRPAPVEDTDTVDAFASFVIKEFEGEHIKEYSFNFIPKDIYEKVNAMLDAADFTESKQAHEFAEEINEFHLKCRCGEPLVFKDCQICNWEKEKDFHFFFATGKKCKCKEVTYLVCADPKDVPAELKDVFI